MRAPESIPLIARAAAHADRVALADDLGEMRYAELLARSERAASALLAGTADLKGARVAFLVPPGRDYVIAQWGIWRAGGIAVPLCTTHPPPELDYTIADSGASALIAHPTFEAVLAAIASQRGLRLVSTRALDASTNAALPRVTPDRGAMILYTSGTTGKPKGVLTTHAILAAQIESVASAWQWRESDRVLHVLPLHHLHGILNLLCCALWSGACCEFQPRFDPERAWSRIESAQELTLFMAVPTIYAKLAQGWDDAAAERRARMSAGCARLRLMVSGSAALPAAMLERWRAISGHTLLERYGMTEFGMGLGNPLHGERRAGFVGVPFPGVDVRLVDERDAAVRDGDPGLIQVRGPGVFREYFGKPDATREAFTHDGWFKTGDVAVFERGMYRILGRESVDILKTGGYKVSALEIEETLREHPAVRECAVVGVADAEWGQRVAAVIVVHDGTQLDLDSLRAWGKARLAPYKVPTLLRVVPELPRNAMGKVTKPDLVKGFATGDG
jgi:malonyl-CoA/methylmalonyl-CoA synthetase